jgi:hypothetical protein
MEECLRLFTNVEVLDNKNMVGCQRCWKIANREREREASRENSDEHEDWTDDDKESSSEEEDEVGFPKSPASLLGPAQTLAMPPEEYVQRGTPWNTVEHRGTPWNTVEHRGTPWNTVEHRGTPWNTVEHRGTPWNTVEHRGTPWNTVEHRGTPWNTVEHRGTPWNTVEHRGTPWNTVEHRGTPWNTVEHRGTPWNTVEHRGTPWNGEMEIWNVVEGSMVGNVQGGACWIKSVKISPDGSRMVVVPSQGEIQLWDVPGLKIFPSTPISLHDSQSASWAFFSQDGSRIAYEYSGWHMTQAQVYIVDAATGEAIGGPFYSYINDANTSSVFSSDFSRMLSVAYDMSAFAVWDFKCGNHSAQGTYRFPPHLMMTLHWEDGWFRGETGEKLLWVPSDERGVWRIIPGRVILGHGTRKLVIVDVEDYSKLPPVHYGWREQVRYIDRPNFQLAGVLSDFKSN